MISKQRIQVYLYSNGLTSYIDPGIYSSNCRRENVKLQGKISFNCPIMQHFKSCNKKLRLVRYHQKNIYTAGITDTASIDLFLFCFVADADHQVMQQFVVYLRRFMTYQTNETITIKVNFSRVYNAYKVVWSFLIWLARLRLYYEISGSFEFYSSFFVIFFQVYVKTPTLHY